MKEDWLNAVSIKANVMVNNGVLIFPDDIPEFCKDWIIVRQVDVEDGMTTGIYYHIRKRTPEDPHNLAMIDSLEEK